MSSNNYDPNQKCILVLEDDELSGRLLEAILVKDGYKVVVCNQAVDAINQLNNSDIKFDLIITDIIMPVMGGFDFIDQLKKENPSKVKPLMIITSLRDQVTMNKAKERGVVDYILKPFKTSDIISRLRRFFEKNDSVSA